MTNPDTTPTPAYPGAPVDLSADARARTLRDAERCHVLPPKNGVRVMTQGVFDILHLGHLHYFQAAKALGDELVVVLARDETVSKNKHTPVFNEDARRELVAALDPVDHAVLGHKGDFYRVVVECQPDIICIGYDQPYKEKAIEEECARRGLEVKVVRLQHMDFDLDSTRKVVEAIGQKLANHELYAHTLSPDQKRLEDVGAVKAEAEADAKHEVPAEASAKTTGHAADKVNQPHPSKAEAKADTEPAPSAEKEADA